MNLGSRSHFGFKGLLAVALFYGNMQRGADCYFTLVFADGIDDLVQGKVIVIRDTTVLVGVLPLRVLPPTQLPRAQR